MPLVLLKQKLKLRKSYLLTLPVITTRFKKDGTRPGTSLQVNPHIAGKMHHSPLSKTKLHMF